MYPSVAGAIQSYLYITTPKIRTSISIHRQIEVIMNIYDILAYCLSPLTSHGATTWVQIYMVDRSVHVFTIIVIYRSLETHGQPLGEYICWQPGESTLLQVLVFVLLLFKRPDRQCVGLVVVAECCDLLIAYHVARITGEISEDMLILTYAIW